jgi:hypothetical protein
VEKERARAATVRSHHSSIALHPASVAQRKGPPHRMTVDGPWTRPPMLACKNAATVSISAEFTTGSLSRRPPKLLGTSGAITNELRTSTKNFLRLSQASLESNPLLQMQNRAGCQLNLFALIPDVQECVVAGGSHLASGLSGCTVQGRTNFFFGIRQVG